jgi:hypothetical protein
MPKLKTKLTHRGKSCHIILYAGIGNDKKTIGNSSANINDKLITSKLSS